MPALACKGDIGERSLCMNVGPAPGVVDADAGHVEAIEIVY